MTDLSIAISITDGALSDLALSRANGYRIARGGMGPGARLWRRQVAESPFVHGRVLVGQTLDTIVAPLHVRVFGTSHAQFTTRLGTLMDRMEQTAYVLQEIVGGITYRWQCECADSAIGDDGAFAEQELAQYQQVVKFLVPRNPVPLAGPL